MPQRYSTHLRRQIRSRHRLGVQHGSKWQLTEKGQKEVELLLY
jgi:hypothetical protein